MRSLIVGGGAIGQFLGACLSQGGHEPTILARSEQARAISASGITMRRGDTSSTRKIAASDGPESAAFQEPIELVIVAVKAYSTSEAIASIAGLPACRNATIMTVQNGLGNEEALAEAFGAERVIAGALTVAVERAGATKVVAGAKGGLTLAPVGSTPHNWVMAAFAGSGLDVRAASDWRALKWSKLLINILGNGVCAALDWSPEEVYANREAFKIERRCLLEAIAVMRHLGLAPINLIDYPSAVLAAVATRLPASVLRVVLANRVAKGRGGKLPSLLMDLRAGHPRSEVSALNGAVAAKASEIGISATANAAVSAVVSGIAAGTLHWDRYRGHPERLFSSP